MHKSKKENRVKQTQTNKLETNKQTNKQIRLWRGVTGSICKQCAHCEVVKEFGNFFHKMQLGRGGKCLACKRGSWTTNLKPQQPLIGLIFINADPRYAGRLDDKQGGDTIVTMDRVREAMSFNAEWELADESTWLWLTGIGANGLSLETNRWREARGESRGFRQQPKGTWPITCDLRITWCLRSLTLFWLKIGNAALTNLNRY